MIEANKFKLGIFITIGVIIIIGGIFIFGISKFFTEKVEIYTVFTDEVEGLVVGAPVKFNGVDLGTVSNIYICENGNIEVQMVLALKSIRKRIRTPLPFVTGNHKEIDKLVQAGLRCSLQLRGITGDKYIRLAYYRRTPLRDNLRVSLEGNACYIPSVPSYLGSAIDNIGKLLEDLSAINFKEVIGELNKNLHSLNNLEGINKSLISLNKLDEINRNLQTLDKIAGNLDSLSKADFKETTDNLNRNLIILGKLADRMEKSLILLNVQELNNSLLNTMNKLNEMSDSLTTLSNNINSNPSSIVWGRKEVSVLKE